MAKPITNFVVTNSQTILHVSSLLALYGVACELGIVTAETSCAIAGVVSIGLGIVATGADLAESIKSNCERSWVNFGLDLVGDIAGVEGLAAAQGSLKAILWSVAGGFDALSAEQINAEDGARRR